MAWSLITFRIADTGSDKAGILRRDGTVVQPELLQSHAGLIAVMKEWGSIAPALRDLDVDALPEIADAKILAPLRFPNKLICAGANYIDHIKEMGSTGVPDGWQPYFFFLPPSTTLVGDGANVRIPVNPDAKIDWEAELAVVIGRRASRVSREDAPDYVAGYACFNDVSARGFHKRAIKIGPPFEWDWASSKAQDEFCPMGPIVPAWMVPDPHALGIRCSVNDELKQNGVTRDLITDVWDLISIASHNFTLEPGDIIATGTPAGVGAGSGTFLKPGDSVTVEIDGFPSLTNRFVEA